MIEKPVRSPIVPPIADNMSTNFAALSLVILSKVGVSKKILTIFRSFFHSESKKKILKQRVLLNRRYQFTYLDFEMTLINNFCYPVTAFDGPLILWQMSSLKLIICHFLNINWYLLYILPFNIVGYSIKPLYLL